MELFVGNDTLCLQLLQLSSAQQKSDATFEGSQETFQTKAKTEVYFVPYNETHLWAFNTTALGLMTEDLTPVAGAKLAACAVPHITMVTHHAFIKAAPLGGYAFIAALTGALDFGPTLRRKQHRWGEVRRDSQLNVLLFLCVSVASDKGMKQGASCIIKQKRTKQFGPNSCWKCWGGWIYWHCRWNNMWVILMLCITWKRFTLLFKKKKKERKKNLSCLL